MATKQGPPRQTPPPAEDRGRQDFPHNLEAERAVLGALIMDPERLDLIADQLTAADFFRAVHQQIFRAIIRLKDASRPVDLTTLREELTRSGDLGDVGPAYLASLLDGMPRGANVAAHAGIVAEKARLRAALQTASRLSEAARAAAQPAADIAAAAAEELTALGGQAVEGRARLLRDLMASGLERLEQASAAKTGTVTGLPTGFDALDDMMTGLQPSDLVLIAARTSQGKTALAMGIARAVAATKPVLIFSLEMSAEQLFMRLLASEAKVDSHRLRSACLREEDWARVAAALGTLDEAKLWIDDTPGIGVREVRARARQLQAQHGLAAVFVDYIQLMKGHGQYDGRHQEIGTISRGLKSVARELSVPVVALAQLSRNAEPAPGRKARRPGLSDLAESGSLENDADAVLLIYRPEPKDGEEDNVAEIIIAKQRNGPTGIVRLAWRKEYVRFENLSL